MNNDLPSSILLLCSGPRGKLEVSQILSPTHFWVLTPERILSTDLFSQQPAGFKEAARPLMAASAHLTKHWCSDCHPAQLALHSAEEGERPGCTGPSVFISHRVTPGSLSHATHLWGSTGGPACQPAAWGTGAAPPQVPLPLHSKGCHRPPQGHPKSPILLQYHSNRDKSAYTPHTSTQVRCCCQRSSKCKRSIFRALGFRTACKGL